MISFLNENEVIVRKADDVCTIINGSTRYKGRFAVTSERFMLFSDFFLDGAFIFETSEITAVYYKKVRRGYSEIVIKISSLPHPYRICVSGFRSEKTAISWVADIKSCRK